MQRTTQTGFLQFRETARDRWRFQVYGFRGEPGTNASCSVYAVDGKREVDIDAKDRIRIEGKWYGRLHWDH
jgi:phage gp45-like